MPISLPHIRPAGFHHLSSGFHLWWQCMWYSNNCLRTTHVHLRKHLGWCLMVTVCGMTVATSNSFCSSQASVSSACPCPHCARFTCVHCSQQWDLRLWHLGTVFNWCMSCCAEAISVCSASTAVFALSRVSCAFSPLVTARFHLAVAWFNFCCSNRRSLLLLHLFDTLLDELDALLRHL